LLKEAEQREIEEKERQWHEKLIADQEAAEIERQQKFKASYILS
jgi:hypothetical protein